MIAGLEEITPGEISIGDRCHAERGEAESRNLYFATGARPGLFCLMVGVFPSV
jgi:hypothetical protein